MHIVTESQVSEENMKMKPEQLSEKFRNIRSWKLLVKQVIRR